MGAVTGRNYFKNRKVMKAIESQTLRSEGSAASTKIKIGDETKTVNGNIHNPEIKEVNRFNPLKKDFKPFASEKKVAEQNAKEMEKFRESLNEALKDSKITPEQIKKIKPEDILRSVEQKGSPLYMLGDTPVGSNQKAYDIARKAGFPIKPGKPVKPEESVKKEVVKKTVKQLPAGKPLAPEKIKAQMTKLRKVVDSLPKNDKESLKFQEKIDK